MGLWLKQSTAVTVKIGPFVDEDDGKTAEAGLAIAQADVRLSKNGGNMAQKNDANACVHDEIGYYDCELDATDTNTLGRLQLMVHEGGALPVFHEYMVLPANVYDSLVAGSDYLQADVIQLVSVAQSATDLKDFADTGYDPATHKVQGVVLCDTTTTNTDVVAVKADTAAILIDTNELQTDWANGGRLDLLLDAAKEAVDTEVAAIKAVTDTLTLGGIADAVLDEVVDANNPANANSLREVVNVMSAALAGKSSGGGTATIKFRDLGDTKDRISATVTADGNRTAVTNDGT